jgi:hypothetical protein
MGERRLGETNLQGSGLSIRKAYQSLGTANMGATVQMGKLEL